MASNIPTRRTTRATRIVATTSARDNENKHAKPSKLISRSKTASNVAGVAGATIRTTSEIDVAAQGKRKREALGEVTTKVTNNRPKVSQIKGKGKDDELDSKPVKLPATTTSVDTNGRQVPRPVAGKVKNSSTTSVFKKIETKVEPKAEPKIETAMAIDAPDLPPVPIVLVPSLNAARRLSTKTTLSTTSLKTIIQRNPPLQVVREEKLEKKEIVLEEPVFKKRRTSSEAGDELQVERPESPIDEAISEFLSESIAKYEEQLDDEVDENWDDLDKDDFEDPMMASEYVNEIFKYLKEAELATLPNPNYMVNQKELDWKMRGVLIDWLIQVHSRFRLCSETLFLCINIIDRFLSARVVSLAKLQLVGVTCMFIASKVEEMVAPTVSNFAYCADSTYTEKEIIQAERYVLKTIDYNMSYPGPMNFLRRISKADEYNVEVRTIGKYLLEVGFMEYRLLAAPPSLLAAAAMWLARIIRELLEWTPNLRHYSTYPESSLLPTATLMIRYVLKPNKHESFFKKYAAKRFMKASFYVYIWAEELWTCYQEVNLMTQWPEIKAELSERRSLRHKGLLTALPTFESIMSREEPPLLFERQRENERKYDDKTSIMK